MTLKPEESGTGDEQDTHVDRWRWTTREIMTLAHAALPVTHCDETVS